MRARVLRDFKDVQCDVIRRKGDVFECSAERFAELENSEHGVLVAKEPKKKVKK